MDSVTIGLFMAASGVSLFSSMISPNRIIRGVLASFAVLLFIVGILIAYGYFPSFSADISAVATNPWAWFILVILSPTIQFFGSKRQDKRGGTLLSQVDRNQEEQRILALAETDRSRIDRGIWLADCRVRWNPDPNGEFDAVYFEFKIFNGSSYPVRFDKIDGYIEYEGRQVRGKIDFYTGKWPLISLAPRFHTSIEVVQRLSVVDMNRLRQDWEKQKFPYFSFKPLRITITDGDDLGRVVPKPLAFSHITSINLQGKLN